MAFKSTEPNPSASAAEQSSDHALLRACRAVLAPLARLAVARGLRYAQIDDLLRSALVEAARDAHSDMPAHRAASRVSAATGLNRREVTRLMKSDAPEASKRSLATELFTRWLSDPRLRHKGEPLRSLPRQGAGKSFESLAQSVTKDVHPRTLLEEMSRLGLAKHEVEDDTVHLLRETFVPSNDEQRMFAFLGNNVGDHLSAAVVNVLGRGPRQLEQAMFADELSRQSIERLEPIVREHWQSLLRELAPTVQAMVDEDAAGERTRDQRLRVGMYAYAGPMAAAAGKAADAVAPAEPAKTAAPSRRLKK
ncbi:MAG TPA: DUF6502 family protein [Albitalea sp.]|nr:DUF6502 family protein [Albitalea sp.]